MGAEVDSELEDRERWARVLYDALRASDPGAHIGLLDHESGTVVDGCFNLATVAAAVVSAARKRRQRQAPPKQN